MVWKVMSAAVIAAAGISGIANAQSRGGPAELPPAGFSGQQYIDSRGCVFLRAGHGGQVNWVQRVSLDRKPLCGYPPTTTTMARAKTELSRPAPASPAPVETASAGGRRPMETVANVTTAPRISSPAPRSSVPAASYAAPRVVMAAPAATVRMAAPSGSPEPTVFASTPQPAAPAPVAVRARAASTAYVPSPSPGPTVYNAVAAPDTTSEAPRVAASHSPILRAATPGCPPDAPVGQLYDLTSGGRVMVCTISGKRFTGLRVGDQMVSASPSATYAGHTGYRTAPVQIAEAAPPVPPGYKPAWTDDRLNPHRARGTASGHAQMNRHWSVDVPQKVIADAERSGQKVRRATVSSKAMPAPAPVVRQAAPQMAGARFVQVGSFGVPDNATRAAQRLRSMGLPVQILRSSIKGKPVQVVRAGPFGSPSEAGSALAAARRAGFGDALLRR
ncbi:MAG: SPOR domain-containing protein [Gemmobacter sp.]|nr:SPOR domain-containing protein [Gemmobacter sp.]